MLNFSEITVTMSGLLSVLYALVAVMLIIVLYHLLFIVVDMRKMARRIEETTAQIEAILLKPLSIIDEGFTWVIDHIGNSKKTPPKKKGKDDKPFDVESV